MMQSLRRLLLGAFLLVLFFIALIYGSDNSAPVALVFLGWESVAWPVAWWVIVAFLIGGVCGTLLASALNLPLRLQLRSVRRQLEESRSELDKLRTLNLK